VLENFVSPTVVVGKGMKDTHTDCPMKYLKNSINRGLILNHYGTAKNLGTAKKITKQLAMC
jgi:hypothetical protein